jgi:hypothetical protein
MTKKSCHGESQPGPTMEKTVMTLFYSLPLASANGYRSDSQSAFSGGAQFRLKPDYPDKKLRGAKRI